MAAGEQTPRKRGTKKASKTDVYEPEPSTRSSSVPPGLAGVDEVDPNAKEPLLKEQKSVYGTAGSHPLPPPHSTRNSEFFYNFWLVLLSLLAFITRAWMIHHPGEVVYVAWLGFCVELLKRGEKERFD
jgi:hypothetical protein